MLACIPVAGLAASSVFLRKRPSGIQVTGILVTLAGVLATVLAASAAPSFSPFGCLMLLLSVISYAMYSVLVVKAEGFSSAEITFVMLMAGAAAFVPLAVIEALAKGSLPAPWPRFPSPTAISSQPASTRGRDARWWRSSSQASSSPTAGHRPEVQGAGCKKGWPRLTRKV